MPEGHTIHRLARDHTPLLVGRPVRASSPQGRFATGAEMLDGRCVERIHPYGKHLFYEFEGDLLLHVHLGLYGKWTSGYGPPPEPRGALRLRMTTDDAWPCWPTTSGRARCPSSPHTELHTLSRAPVVTHDDAGVRATFRPA